MSNELRSYFIWWTSRHSPAVEDYKVINLELAAYNEDLARRPQIVVATKIDALDEPDRLAALENQAKKDKKPFFAISSATGAGVKELVKCVSLRIFDKAEPND